VRVSDRRTPQGITKRGSIPEAFVAKGVADKRLFGLWR